MAADSDRAMRAKMQLAEAVTAPTARKYVSKLLAIATGEELEGFTMKTWGEEWLRRKERDSSKATMARYRGHMKSWLDWLGDARRKKPLESITTQEAKLWRETLQDEGRTGKTVLSYTKDIDAAFRAAIREGLVSYNPFTALETIDTSDSLDRKPFAGDEVGKLLSAAPSEEWRGLILVAAFKNTAVRTSATASSLSRLGFSAAKKPGLSENMAM